MYNKIIHKHEVIDSIEHRFIVSVGDTSEYLLNSLKNVPKGLTVSAIDKYVTCIRFTFLEKNK